MNSNDLFDDWSIKVHTDKAPKVQEERYTKALIVLNWTLIIVQNKCLYSDCDEREFSRIIIANIRLDYGIDHSVFFSTHTGDKEKYVKYAQWKADTAHEEGEDVILVIQSRIT